MRKYKAPVLEKHVAALCEPFGYEYACRLFGAGAIDGLPRYVAGPKKGRLKGWLHWQKALKPGWVPGVGAYGVGLFEAWVGEGRNSYEGVVGEWFDRKQCLKGSFHNLSPEARERDKRQRERAAADWEEEKAEILERMAARKAAAAQ